MAGEWGQGKQEWVRINHDRLNRSKESTNQLGLSDQPAASPISPVSRSVTILSLHCLKILAWHRLNKRELIFLTSEPRNIEDKSAVYQNINTAIYGMGGSQLERTDL